MTAQRTVLIPYMGNYSKVIEAVLRGFGIHAMALSASSEASIKLAAGLLKGGECFPCLITLGDLLKALDEVKEDQKITFFMPTAGGSCRFGLYKDVQKLALKKLGFNGIEFISPDNREGYSFGGNGRVLELTFWKGIVCVDIFEMIVSNLRPYLNHHDVQHLEHHYEKFIKMLLKSLKNKAKGLKDILFEANKGFEYFLYNTSSHNKPKVGLVGEIFVRGNNFANGEIVKLLEGLDLEVRITPMSEWIHWIVDKHAQTSKKPLGVFPNLPNTIKSHILYTMERKLRHQFKKFSYLFKGKTPFKLVRNASPYANTGFGGEGLLTLGKAIELIEEGIDGIVCIHPFGCMPGNVIRVLSESITRDFHHVPWLNISMDYQENTHRKTRLEAFAGQVMLRKERSIHVKRSGFPLFKKVSHQA